MKTQNRTGTPLGAIGMGIILMLAPMSLPAANPTVTITNLVPQYPWTNIVEVTYSVSNYDSTYSGYRWFAIFEGKNGNGASVGIATTNQITANGTGFVALWSAPKGFLGQVSITPSAWRKPEGARQYVQDGLVAVWDGTDNNGWGKHSSTIRTWKELISGWNGSLDTNASWVANAMVVSGNGFPCRVPANISQVIATKNFTVELAVKPSRDTVRCTLFGNYSEAQSYNFEAHLKNDLRAYYTGDPDLFSDGGFYEANVKQTYSQTTSTTSQKIWKNASVIYTNDGAINSSLIPGSDTILAGELSRSHMAAYGQFFCFRLYNKALTAEEIAHNYKIDRSRFGY